MRGKVVHGSMLRTTSRITPAYAGKSGQSTYKNYECGDHPRLCGEKGIQKCRCWYGRGSPPPMRGKAALPAVPLLRSGITPAYAGKRFLQKVYAVRVQDHPRLCGEKCVAKRQIVRILGSPPPMRGKVSHSANSGFPVRITPAYAGKRKTTGKVKFKTKDHPRLCGEKAVQRGDITGMSGSPPPMRGKVIQYQAGAMGLKDHPRLCGEKFRVRL